MASVKSECESCGGTGLYRGMAEPKGVAVVCVSCDGTGCREITYKPFTARKPRSDVKEVRRSRGTFVLSCGPVGRGISYEEFSRGALPPDQKSR